jgi:hypothetical protein
LFYQIITGRLGTEIAVNQISFLLSTVVDFEISDKMAVWKTVLALASILSFVFGELLIRELSNDQVSYYSSGLIFFY